MSAQIDAAKNNADKYASMVLHYSHNAEKYLKIHDHQKASEMMWGSMSCTLKTIAATKNKKISGHKALGEFAIMLSKQQQDKEILNSYFLANMLHRNFYESNLDYSEVFSYCTNITKTIGRLMKKMGYKSP